VDIHVDGASGALLAAFCTPDVLFDVQAAPGQVDRHLGA
jgi:hypothetical protein